MAKIAKPIVTMGEASWLDHWDETYSLSVHDDYMETVNVTLENINAQLVTINVHLSEIKAKLGDIDTKLGQTLNVSIVT